MLLFRLIRSNRRALQILAILVKRSFLYLRLRTGLMPGAASELSTRRKRINKARFARETLEKLGSTFVKFGQFLSVRPDLVSTEVRREFRSLQDKVSPFHFKEVERILNRELAEEYTNIFSKFEKWPLASASMSQVHKAQLKTGETVAVKVQRPRIRKEMEADIMIMAFLAKLIERLIPRLRKNRPVMLVDEFSQWSQHELDFYQEGKNASHFQYHFDDFDGVRFPKAYLHLSTEKVLIMEYLDGQNLLDVPAEKIDKQKIVELLIEAMLKQMFQDGFYHADPHPGNILVMDEDQIALLDFGIVGYLRKELREWAFDCLVGMAQGDINRVIDSFIELCSTNEDGMNITAYRRHIFTVLGDLHVCQISDIAFSSILEKFLNTSLEYGLHVPEDVVIMSKAIATLEGTCQTFAPEIKIIDVIKPNAQKILALQPDLDTVTEQFLKGPYEAGRWARLISRRLYRILNRFERGNIRLESDEFKQFVSEMDKSSVNISYGVIISALILLPAILGDDSAFEQWIRQLFELPDIPVLALISLALAGYLSLMLYLRNRA